MTRGRGRKFGAGMVVPVMIQVSTQSSPPEACHAASSSSPTAVLVDDSDPVVGELAAVPPAPPGLLQCLQKVTDPRKRRGVRHSITGVLAVALAATLAGAQSFLGIAEWAANAGPGELTAFGLGGVVPCESTIRRCLQRLDPAVWTP